jgi:hypothetical protein
MRPFEWPADENVSVDDRATSGQNSIGRTHSSVRAHPKEDPVACNSMAQDPWETQIATYLVEHPSLHVMSASEALMALGFTENSQHRSLTRRAGRVLRGIGWSKKFVRLESGPTQRFVSPDYLGPRARKAAARTRKSPHREGSDVQRRHPRQLT